MRRFVSVGACLAALLVLPLPARGAPPPPPKPAAAIGLFARAEESFAALRASAQSQRQRQNFTRALEAYRRVFEKYPTTPQGEQSLMRAGELQTLLFRWTGQEGDLNQAQNYYQRLIQTAPKSPLVDDALLAIAFLYLDHFKDPAQAWLRFREVIQRSPRGDKTPVAKRQLKRLARYAVDKPVPDTGPVELSCPVPTSGASGGGSRGSGAAGPASTVPGISAVPAAVIAMPAPPVIAMPPASGQPLPKLPASPAATGTAPALNRVRAIRHWSNPEYSRVVIDLDQKTNFYSNLLDDRSGSAQSPRLYIDLFSSLVEERFCKPIVVNDGILHGIRAGQSAPDRVRVVLEIDGLRTYRVFPMQNPFRIVVDVTGGAPGIAPTPGTPAAADLAAPGVAPVDHQAAPAKPAPALSARSMVLPPLLPYTPVPVPELIPLPLFTPPGNSHGTAAPPAALVPAAPPTTFSGAAPDVAPGPSRASPPTSSATPSPAPAATPSPSRTRSARQAAGASRPPSAPSPSGKPSLARQLGLGVRRVVIDAGHGAHDPGAIGIDGLQEKDVTLDLALRVRDLLHAAGYETVLTRDRDVYLPLEERMAIANTARGDLFLSLHCNASDAGNLSGVETYFLNLASSVRSMQTAARENSMAVANMSDLQQIVREIQNSKMDESSQFAARVQRSLHDALHRKFPDIKNLGVKQAPFYVLIGAQMPSVLAEVSFINNPKEGRRLADPAYRQLIAQALADGVKRYVRTVKTAALSIPRRPTP